MSPNSHDKRTTARRPIVFSGIENPPEYPKCVVTLPPYSWPLEAFRPFIFRDMGSYVDVTLIWLCIAGYVHHALAPTTLLYWIVFVSHLWYYFIDLGTISHCVRFLQCYVALIYMAREAEAMLPSGTITFSYGNTADCVTDIPGSYTRNRE
ncbi:hypothetical protein GGR51DRAFT_39809 [Nemania sp. FL0031]|nr:hypothetical protein GGR51DRAFT_39809 [Nemania sp. FL0031]